MENQKLRRRLHDVSPLCWLYLVSGCSLQIQRRQKEFMFFLQHEPLAAGAEQLIPSVQVRWGV